jgi:hypothetical protein
MVQSDSRKDQNISILKHLSLLSIPKTPIQSFIDYPKPCLVASLYVNLGPLLPKSIHLYSCT